MLTAVVLAFFFQAQPANEPKLAKIEGSVSHAGSKTAIRKAKVSLTAIGSEGGGSVETADDGFARRNDRRCSAIVLRRRSVLVDAKKFACVRPEALRCCLVDGRKGNVHRVVRSDTNSRSTR